MKKFINDCSTNKIYLILLGLLLFVLICLIIGFSIFLSRQLSVRSNKKQKNNKNEYNFSEALYFSNKTTPLIISWSYDFSNSSINKDFIQFEILFQTCTDVNNPSTCSNAYFQLKKCTDINDPSTCSDSESTSVIYVKPISNPKGLTFTDNNSVRTYTYILDKNSGFDFDNLTPDTTYYLSIRADYNNNTSVWTIPNDSSSVYNTSNIEQVPYFDTWFTAIPGQKLVLSWNQSILAQPGVSDQLLVQTNCYRLSHDNADSTLQDLFSTGQFYFYNISYDKSGRMIIKVNDSSVSIGTTQFPSCTSLSSITNSIIKSVNSKTQLITYTFYLVSDKKVVDKTIKGLTSINQMNIESAPYGTCFSLDDLSVTDTSKKLQQSELFYYNSKIADPNNNNLILSISDCSYESSIKPIQTDSGSLLCPSMLYQNNVVNTTFFTLPCLQTELFPITSSTDCPFIISDNTSFQGASVLFQYKSKSILNNLFFNRQKDKYASISKMTQYPPYIVIMYLKTPSDTTYMYHFIYSSSNADIMNESIRLNLNIGIYTCYIAIYIAECNQGSYVEIPFCTSNSINFNVSLPSPTSLVVVNES